MGTGSFVNATVTTENTALADAPAPFLVSIAEGGTGATTAAQARTNLGLGSIAVEDSPLPLTKGGTGATSAADARTSLGLTLTVDSWTPVNASAVSNRCQFAKYGHILVLYCHITLTSALNNGNEIVILQNVSSSLNCTINPSILMNAIAYAYSIGIARLFYNPTTDAIMLSNTSGANFPASTSIYSTFVTTID